MTDPEVPPLPPHIRLEHAKGFARALLHGDPDSARMVAPVAAREAQGPGDADDRREREERSEADEIAHGALRGAIAAMAMTGMRTLHHRDGPRRGAAARGALPAAGARAHPPGPAPAPARRRRAGPLGLRRRRRGGLRGAARRDCAAARGLAPRTASSSGWASSWRSPRRCGSRRPSGCARRSARPSRSTTCSTGWCSRRSARARRSPRAPPRRSRRTEHQDVVGALGHHSSRRSWARLPISGSASRKACSDSQRESPMRRLVCWSR